MKRFRLFWVILVVFSSCISGASAQGANNAPTFVGGAAIETISAIAGTAITPQVLPMATDADSDIITYSISPTLPAGLTFDPVTRLLYGTPTAVSPPTVYTYTASDGTDSASLNFVIIVSEAQVVDIPDANLRAAIAQALNKAPGDAITRAEMETLVELWATNRNIADLRGIEFAINLTYLNLYGNTISDISAVSSLTNLIELNLENNNISDISAVSSLTNLTELYLRGNNILDISAVAGLTNLTELYLRGNKISNISPLARLTNLMHMQLSVNTILDISPLENLTNLTWLDLDRNKISDLSPLTSLANLTRLRLWDNTVSDISPLASLTNLTYLNLGANNISNIVPLITLTNLTHLHVHSNNITDIETIERLMAQGTVVYFSDNPAFETPGPKIENGWIWLIVPATDVRSGGDAARSNRDFLSEASGGSVTETDVAHNGARAGTQVGGSVWTSATLNAADPDNLNAIVRDYNLGTDIDYPVAYGVVSIQSETQQQTRVYIGGGPVKVWLNGTLVHKDTTHHHVNNYQTAVPVLLIPGENLLFITAYRSYPGNRWGAFFGFQDGTGYTIGAPGPGGLDVNRDGKVDVLDLIWVAVSYGMRGVGLPADVNTDGVVNVQDLVAVAAGVDAAAALPLKVVEDILLAAEGAAAKIDGIAGAPVTGFGARPHALSSGIAYRNVAAALVDVEHLVAGDVRLVKGVALLERLLSYLREMATIPETTALLPNYPNPFNPETWIPYHLAKDAEVKLTIYDVRGEMIRAFVLGHQPAGIYERRGRAAYWDGRNALGEPVSSGLYFYTLTAGDFTATRRLLIAK